MDGVRGMSSFKTYLGNQVKDLEIKGHAKVESSADSRKQCLLTDRGDFGGRLKCVYVDMCEHVCERVCEHAICALRDCVCV